MNEIFKCDNCGTKYHDNDASAFDVSICKWCDARYYFSEPLDRFIEIQESEVKKCV